MSCCLVVFFFSKQLNTISYYFPRDTIPQVLSSVLSYLLHTYGASLQLYTKTISHTGTTSPSAERCQDGRHWRRFDWKQLKEKGNWNTKFHLGCSGPHWLIKPKAVKGAQRSVVSCRTPLELWQSILWGSARHSNDHKVYSTPTSTFASREICVYKYSSYTYCRLK